MTTEVKVEVADNGWVILFRQGEADYSSEAVTKGKLIAPDLDAVMMIIRGLIEGGS